MKNTFKKRQGVYLSDLKTYYKERYRWDRRLDDHVKRKNTKCREKWIIISDYEFKLP